MIKLKRAYEAAAPADGLRILVERLWPRGRNLEPAASYLVFNNRERRQGRPKRGWTGSTSANSARQVGRGLLTVRAERPKVRRSAIAATCRNGEGVPGRAGLLAGGVRKLPANQAVPGWVGGPLSG